MKTEVSAGGVVVRKRKKGWEVLIVRDMNNEWTFPKGKVDRGETREQAAKREIREEVGITQVTKFLKLPVIHYWYRRNGLISKTVHYFVFTSTGDETPVNQREEGIHEATWVPIRKAIDIIGYTETNKQLLLWTLKKLPT